MDSQGKVHLQVILMMKGQGVGIGQGQVQKNSGESGKVTGVIERRRAVEDSIRKNWKKLQGNCLVIGYRKWT